MAAGGLPLATEIQDERALRIEMIQQITLFLAVIGVGLFDFIEHRLGALQVQHVIGEHAALDEADPAVLFRGGPFLESRYFGEGVGIAVRRGNELMRLAVNWALFRIWENGKFTDLWLRYFPISPF